MESRPEAAQMQADRSRLLTRALSILDDPERPDQVGKPPDQQREQQREHALEALERAASLALAAARDISRDSQEKTKTKTVSLSPSKCRTPHFCHMSFFFSHRYPDRSSPKKRSRASSMVKCSQSSARHSLRW